jgi:hypothetical protein
MRGVSIEFAGKNRLLKYPHGLIGDLEQEANKILAPLLAKGEMVFAPGIFGQWLGNSKIFSLALLYGLKHEDADLSIEQVNEGIDAYEGGLDALGRQMTLAFRMARDPSSVASLKASWEASDERQKILETAQQIQEKGARMEAEASLKDAEKRMAEIQKKFSGKEAPGSEPSSA